VEIQFSDIGSISLSKKPLEKNDFTKSLSPLGELESHNVIISLKKEKTLIGLYGIRRRFTVLGLHVDKPTEFKEKIESTILPRSDINR